ncbi:alpha/beta fold hydrolase [Hydrogenoanaerobacterium sp.]|uniref:alpha/beta fold hydrolase n=1 Tax=Hydrogenoanaerobacterium sp. TaxID=2953763 RepID=UPI00289D28D3|nr:alpha/beta fold hydrolase [Hydrogenoanaerobacterium sp.]
MGYNTELISYPSANGTDTVSAKLFIPTDIDITAIVQISHGMCEYIDRYHNFAEFLCGKGFMVCGNDHIGHHHSAADAAALGFFSEKDGCSHLVADVHTLTLQMKERFPGMPYFLLGHSMGSFVARCCLADFGEEYDGAIISGTGGPNPLTGVAIKLANLLCKTQGPRKRSKLLDNLAFGKYNDRFEKRTDKDWLTRDHAIVDAYRADPNCSFLFTNAAFRDLFTLTNLANQPTWAHRLPKNLPIFIFSGEDDPVGNYGEGVQKVYEMIKDAGLFDVALKLYKGGRHEMLNELNRNAVYEDIYEWVKRKI